MHEIDVDTINRVVVRETGPGWSLENICHPDHAVFVCSLRGACDYHILNNSFRIRRGEALLLQPGIVHSVHSVAEDPWTLASCVFGVRNFDDLPQTFIGPLPVSPRTATIFSELNAAWISKRVGFEMRCKGLLLQALSDLAERSSVEQLHAGTPHTDKIIEALTMIDNNLDKEMSVQELSAACSLSVSRFRTLFTQIVGMSPLKYKNRAKMIHARELLASGEFNVSEAAAVLGFENVFYFSRLFKKIIGHPPAACKK